MENKRKYHSVGTVPKSNRKRVERSKIDTSNTKHVTVNFTITSGWVRLVLWVQT